MRILLLGAGGLGAPALMSLAARGVAPTVWDPDRLELSNLHRQILYSEAHVGRPKAEAAAEMIARRFGLTIDAEVKAFRADQSAEIAAFDLVIDATDGFDTKLAIADACVDQDVPFVFGGVVGHEGQAMAVRPRTSACVRCLFDEAPPPGGAPTCAEIGILGPVAGIVAAEQVDLALGLLDGSARVDAIFTYDGRRDRGRWVPLRRAADCRGCGSRRHLRGYVGEAPYAGETSAPELDLRGWVCPDTYIQTAKALLALAPKGRLWVRLSSDEAARNVPKSAIAAGHRVLIQRSDGRVHHVLIERGEGDTSHGNHSSSSHPAPEVHGR